MSNAEVVELTDEPVAYIEYNKPIEIIDDIEPTEDELATLEHVSESIPIGAWLIVFCELCERFAFYGLAAPFQNYIEHPAAPPAALFYGQASFPDEKECQKLLDILHVNLSSAQMYELTHPPFKGSILPSLPPTDPLLYRFHEILLQYGVPMKEVIHEKFGDGIMSAVDFTIKVDKDETIKEAPRVNINMSGKFLPYKRW
ncbi:unnamed protein product [Rotaria sordida]|uniref:Cyanate lyase C-terminal domain-containing protein n=2 Tax=Rotaria sordida TaxID=392033 RepID=A0A813UVV9_9BILA|nr:unnamed protein product [Rotaria sordida]